jgi:hypothetical protein
MTGVSSRYSPRGLTTHDQPIRVPFATGSKPRVPAISAAGMWIADASRRGRSKAVYSMVIPVLRPSVTASAPEPGPAADGSGRELLDPADAWVVPRLVSFIGNEVEHLMDWSMDDKLTLYLCHGECTSLCRHVGQRRGRSTGLEVPSVCARSAGR